MHVKPSHSLRYRTSAHDKRVLHHLALNVHVKPSNLLRYRTSVHDKRVLQHLALNVHVKPSFKVWFECNIRPRFDSNIFKIWEYKCSTYIYNVEQTNKYFKNTANNESVAVTTRSIDNYRCSNNSAWMVCDLSMLIRWSITVNGAVWSIVLLHNSVDSSTALFIRLTGLKPRGPPRAGVHATF